MNNLVLILILSFTLLKVFYCALVWLILEYDSVLWDPSTVYTSTLANIVLERV